MRPLSTLLSLKTLTGIILIFCTSPWASAQNYQALDILQAEASGLAEITHTAFDIGSKAQVFDADDNTLARSANINPLVVTITFQEPITLVASSINSSHFSGESNWRLEISNSLSDLEAQTGTYQQLIDRQIYSDVTDSVGFSAIDVKVIRLTLTKLIVDDYVHLNDWQLIGLVNLESLGFKKRVITREGNLFEPLDTMELLETWWDPIFVEANTSSGIPIKIPFEEVNWSIQDTSIGQFRWVENEYKLQAKKTGETLISGTYQGLSASFVLKVNPPVRPVEYEEIDPYLQELDPCSVHEQRVVIIRYMPTTDGTKLDKNVVNWNISIDNLRDRINTFDRRVKFMLTEGSKYQGYKNSAAKPTLGYKIVDVINVYETLPNGKATGDATNSHFPDYYQIVDRFNGDKYVNELGVDEFWLWGWHNDEIVPAESNMSSPTTGDISNSFRFQDDLPVYDHTYVLYNYSFTRTQAEAVHNHGHQLEAIYMHADQNHSGNREMFLNKFVGWGPDFEPPIGRVGDTHHPPNTTKDYDYLNYNLVESDIEDWRPDGKGNKKLVNANTWGDLDYAWPDENINQIPQRIESQWYIYWMQNMPGYGNTIPHGDQYMTNWWEFTADWDAAIQKGLGLHGSDPAPGPPQISVSLLQGVTCPDEANGRASIEIAGDDLSNFSFQWDNGGTSALNTSLSSGVHQVTVTDAKGCPQQYEVEVPAPDTFATQVSVVSQLSCHDAQDGVLQISATGDAGPFTYRWSTGDTTPSIQQIGAGDYQVTVTNIDGCTQIQSINLSAPNALSSQLQIEQDILCFGDQSGQISTTLQGGTAPYSFDWSNGAKTPDLQQIGTGDYTITVTDVNGCTQVQSVSLDEPDSLSSLLQIEQDILCFGDQSGQISTTVLGGTAPYSFDWSNGAKTPELQKIGAGDYTLSLTDANGCTQVQSVSLDEPDSLSTQLQIEQDILCFGDQSGQISTTVQGGTAPYSFDWNSGETTPNLQQLDAGDYSLTITDANGCTQVQSVSLDEPDSLSTQLQIEQDILCFGDQNGRISTTVLGGTAPYSFDWSNGAKTPELQKIGAGDYTLSLTDANGCTQVQSVSLAEPDSLSTQLQIEQPILCFGEQNGQISTTLQGGTAPYSFDWSNGETTPNLQILDAGDYSLTVTDVNGCTQVQSVSLDEPDSLSSQLQIDQDILCFGDQSGQISTTVQGGTAPYSFDWSNGKSTSNLQQLAAGEYSLTITDVNGCTQVQSVSLDEPDSLSTQLQIEQDILCFGDQTGQISTSVQGGTAPYSFDWSNGAKTPELQQIGAGDYTLSLTDANGCTQTLMVNLAQAEAINVDYTVQADTNNLSLGAVTFEVDGGQAPYQVYFEDERLTQLSIDSLMSGVYDLTVIDDKACLKVIPIEIPLVTNTKALNLIKALKVYPNPTDGHFTISGTLQAPQALTIEVYNTLGKLIHLEQFDKLQTLNTTIPLSRSLPSGLYLINIRTEHKNYPQKIIKN